MRINKKIIHLVLLVNLIGPFSTKAQYSDFFNPVQVRLEHLIWSDSLAENERIWMQSVLDTLSYSERETAIIAQGVYLEEFGPNHKSAHSEFEVQMNNKLQLAKMSPDPTSYLLSSLPYAEMANRPKSIHPYSTANDYVLKFLLIRIVITQRLGSFEGEIGNPVQDKIDTIAFRLFEICIMDCRNCYDEGSWLILGLGKLALPELKMEFLSPDKKRVEMASQLLLYMKDEGVVRWLMEVITTSRDKDVLSWSPAYLLMMEKFTPNPMPNRGITEEESDRLTDEIIEPFFKTLYQPVQKHE